jgi:ubiquinone/menaquinone biosynthesis C-methylase UbiE
VAKGNRDAEGLKVSGSPGMAGEGEPFRKYRDAEGYDAYMGGWSALLSPPFIDFVGIAPDARVLDVGCGTGNLLAALRAIFPQAMLTGVDPSAELLDKARRRTELARVAFAEGAVEALPFAGGSFDCTLSLLVLQEFRDRPQALSEMKRVTRAGGIVAACQWHFARMPVIDALVEAIKAVNPAAGERVDKSSPPVFADETELIDWWTRAGFTEVTAGRITVTRRFDSFEDIWRPLSRGATPSTLTLASLPPGEQAAIREMMMARFTPDPTGGLVVAPEALVVRGRA